MATEPKANAVPGKKKSKFRLVFIIVLVASLAGAACYYYLFHGPYTVVREEPAPPVQTVDMGDMTVNLADAGARYLRVRIVVELPENSELEEEFDAREHRIRHDLLLTLRQKTVTDVRHPEDQERLSAELLERVNSHLTAGKADGLFFREYLVQ